MFFYAIKVKKLALFALLIMIMEKSMLTIRKETMQKMQKIREVEQSIPRLCQHLRQNYSDTQIAEWSDEELIKKVQQAVDDAHSFGLKSESDIYGFTRLELTQCPDFHQHPQVQILLKDPEAHPEMRMLWLAQKLPDNVWAEIS